MHLVSFSASQIAGTHYDGDNVNWRRFYSGNLQGEIERGALMVTPTCSWYYSRVLKKTSFAGETFSGHQVGSDRLAMTWKVLHCALLLVFLCLSCALVESGGSRRHDIHRIVLKGMRNRYKASVYETCYSSKHFLCYTIIALIVTITFILIEVEYHWKIFCRI